MNRRFWSGKRVFVTGHTGFKGGWLCAWLVDAGAEVAGFGLAPSTVPSLFEAAGLAQNMHSTIGDVRDPKALESALRAHRPEIVFHLAAQPLVKESYEQPVETFETNVVGTANVLQSLRAADARAVVNVTSDKCYEASDAYRRHNEEDPLGGSDPYSASKACAELVTAAFRRSFFSGETGIATARAGNVLGGGDFTEGRLVPDLVRAFSAGRQAMIRRPDAIRPWQHVLDPLSGYVRLAEALYEDPSNFSSPWNFGPPPEHEVPVRQLADAAARQWGGSASWSEGTTRHPPEAAALRLDSAKAARHLDWHARVSLDAALAWTLQWHRKFDRGAGARELMLEDIARFEKATA